MKFVRICGICGMLALLGLPARGSAEEPPAPEDVLARMVQRGAQVQEQFKEQELVYSKRSIVERVGQDGSVKDREEKLYEVLFKDGGVRMTLLEVNGEMTEEAAAREEIASARAGADDGELKRPRGEERPLVLTQELLERYDFEMLEPASTAGRDCFVLKFQPKPGLPEEGLADRFMNRLQGRVWVDQQEYEVVRAELGLASPVKIVGGLVGALNQFSYTLERTPIGPGLWLNRDSRSHFELRKVLVSRQYRTRSEWRSIQPGAGPELTSRE